LTPFGCAGAALSIPSNGQPIRQRKTREPNLFRQRDVEKAVRAAFAAGAQSVRIQVGGVTILADKSQPIQGAAHSENEWDSV
jgi:hypothetical protein